MRKTIVGIGLLFFIVGFAALLFPAEETHEEVLEVDEWVLASRTLAPSGEDQDSTFYGRLMKPDWWFQLNVSSSDSIRLTVSIFRHDPDEKVPIFIQAGTNFNQQVYATNTGTYFIDLENESPSSVTLEGNVLAKQSETTYSNVYPYALPGYITMVAGASILTFGIFKKPKKPSKPKTKIVRKIQP